MFAELRAVPVGGPRWLTLRERLTERHLPLVRYLTRRVASGQEPLADLLQVGALGLVKAIERFDPDRGVDFAGYAAPVIIGEIKRHLRDCCWLIHVPRRARDLQSSLSAAVERLSQQLHRAPTIAELAAHTGLAEDVVIEALDAGRGYAGVPLDALTADDPATASARFESRLAQPEYGLDRVEQRALLSPALRSLPQREREILALRFFADHTQTEIAALIGVSQMQVSRLIAHALTSLREWFTAHPPATAPPTHRHPPPCP